MLLIFSLYIQGKPLIESENSQLRGLKTRIIITCFLREVVFTLLDLWVTLNWIHNYNNGSTHFVIFLGFCLTVIFVNWFCALKSRSFWYLKLHIHRQSRYFRCKVTDTVQWRHGGQCVFWVGFLKTSVTAVWN